MRYEVGQDYPFTRVNYEPGFFRLGHVYLPWDDTLHSIEHILLKCTGHYKVPLAYGEGEGDGFVFAEQAHIGGAPVKPDRVWYNQYPVAVYQQLSDVQDRMVRPGDETPDAWLNERPFWDSRAMLSSIERALNPHRPDEQQITEQQKVLLREHRDKLIEGVEEITGKRVWFTEWELRPTKPDDIVPRVFHQYWEAQLR